jgi:hypothetical protein
VELRHSVRQLRRSRENHHFEGRVCGLFAKWYVAYFVVDQVGPSILPVRFSEREMDSVGSWSRSVGSARSKCVDDRTTLARQTDEWRGRSTSRVALERMTRGRLPPPPASVVLDLSLVDKAFGPKSDLYWDVLRVKPDASPKQIRRAYFQRRDELFKRLSDIDEEEAMYDLPANRSSRVTNEKRWDVDCKMNGIVMAIRILDDPVARQSYDTVRMDRLLRPTASFSQSLKDFVSEYHMHDNIRSETMAVLADLRKSESSEYASRKGSPRPVRRNLDMKLDVGSNATGKAFRRKTQVLDLLWRTKSSSPDVCAAITPTWSSKSDKDSRSPSQLYPAQQGQQMCMTAASVVSRNQIRDRSGRSDTRVGNPCYYYEDEDDADADDEFDARPADIIWIDQGTVVSDVASDLTTATAAGAWSRRDYDTNGIVACLSNELCGAVEIMAAHSGQVFDILALEEEDRVVRHRVGKPGQQASGSLDRYDQESGKKYAEAAARANAYDFAPRSKHM